MGWCWKAQRSDEPPLGLSPHDDSWGCQLFLCLFLGQCNPGRGVWSHRSQDTDGTRGVEPPTSRVCPWSMASVQWFAAISWVPAAPVSPNWPCWSWGSAGTNPGATTHPKSGAQLWLRSQMGPRHGHTILLPHFIFPPSHRCYNCGGLDHHAKECKLPPQPKKCHFCQSISHMVANCPVKAQQSPSSQGKPAYFREEEDMHSSALLPESRE